MRNRKGGLFEGVWEWEWTKESKQKETIVADGRWKCERERKLKEVGTLRDMKGWRRRTEKGGLFEGVWE